MRDRGSLGFVAPTFTALDQAGPIQHGMLGSDGRALQVRIQSSEFLGDLWRTPVRVLLLELHDQLLDLHRQPVGIVVGSSGTGGPAGIRG